MPRKPAPPTTLETQIDDLLAGALSAGWDDTSVKGTPMDWQTLPGRPNAPAGPEKVADTLEVVKNKRASAALAAMADYPPLPVREFAMPDARSTAGAITHDPEFEGGDEPTPPKRRHELMNIGLLADLAAGRRTPAETAEAAGITLPDLEGAMATTLKAMDPKEIAKAMGIQAAQEQLKAGALFGMVIHDLVQDMMAGKLAPAMKLQLAELLSVIGRIKPKEDKSVGAGGGFVLNISMGSAPAPAAPFTIEQD